MTDDDAIRRAAGNAAAGRSGGATTTGPGNRSAAEIEREVERTRANLVRTLDELRGRLSPGQVVDQLTVWARGSGGAEFARNLGAQLRDNPLPVLLIGAGIGWMMLGGGGTSRRGAGEARRALPPPAQGTRGDGVRDDAWVPEEGELATRRPGAPPGAPHAEEAAGLGHPEGGAAGMPDSAAEARAAVLGRGGAGGAATGGGEGLGDRVADTASEAAESVSAAAGAAYRGVSEAAAGAGRAAASSYQGAADTASAAYRGAAGLAGEAGTRARRLAEGAREGAGEALGRAGETARRGWSWLVHEQPLVLGAIGLAIGAAIGAALPRTEAEDRLMGETRDDLARRVGQGARAAAGAVGEQAAEQYGRVRQTLDTAAGEVRGAVDGEGLRQAGEAAGQVARDLTGAVRDAVHEGAEETKAAVQRAGEAVAPPDATAAGTDAADPAPRRGAARPGEGGPATAPERREAPPPAGASEPPVPDPARRDGPL